MAKYGDRISIALRNGRFRSWPSPSQHSAKRLVALQMPLAAHGGAAGLVAFGIEDLPLPLARGLCTRARVVLLQPRIEIDRPPDIGAASVAASQNVDVAIHATVPAKQA